MRVRTRLSLVLAITLLAACGQSADAHLAQAREAFVAQDFARARTELIAGLEVRPDDPAMARMLAESLLRLGDPEGARRIIATLRRLSIDPLEADRLEAEADLLAGQPGRALERLGNDGHPEAWRIRAAAYLRQNALPEALDAFERGMAAGDDARLIADYAWFELAANDLDGAARLLARLKRVSAVGLETGLLEGGIAARQGRTEEALAAYRKTARRYSACYQPLVAEAELLFDIGRSQDAAKPIAQALAIAPTEPRAKLLGLRLAAAQGEWAKLRAALQGQEADMDPLSTDNFLYAQALLHLGHPEQARVRIARTVLLDPNNVAGRHLLAETQLAVSDPGAAADALAPLVEDAIPDPASLTLLERAFRMGQDPEADAVRVRLLSNDYRRLAGLVAAGRAAMARADWTGAVAAYSPLMDHGANAAILTDLAYAAGHTGDWDRAAAAAQRALALTPDNPATLIAAARAQLGAGRKDEARRLLTAVLERRSGDAEAAVLLAQTKATPGAPPEVARVD